jgi:drug/metabolite transporter (DMT)-like permease
VIFNVALVEGARHAEPAVLGVAVACAPPLLAVAGPLLEGTRPRIQAIVAAVIVTCGAVLVQGLGRADAIGLGCAAVVFAGETMFTLFAIPVLRRHGPWGVSAHTTWLAAVMFAVLGAVREGPGALARLNAHEWLATGYLAVVTVAAFVMWYSCVGRIGAGRAGLLAGVAPMAAALSGILLGHPAPRPLVWAGIAVVIAGLAAGLREREGKQRVLQALRSDLARLSRTRAGGPVRFWHQPGGERGRRRREVLGPGANEPAGERTAADPGLASRLR